MKKKYMERITGWLQKYPNYIIFFLNKSTNCQYIINVPPPKVYNAMLLDMIQMRVL